MWKQKIGISVGNDYSRPTTEIIDIVANAGFDAISPVWEDNIDVDSIVNAAKDNGLILHYTRRSATLPICGVRKKRFIYLLYPSC